MGRRLIHTFAARVLAHRAVWSLFHLVVTVMLRRHYVFG